MGQYPVGAAAPAACAKLYNIPRDRLRRAIRNGECEAPRVVGRRSVLKYASIEQWLETFPTTKERANGHR
jgi:excisionase family DNA binding protein